jgi:hypothetical protein
MGFLKPDLFTRRCGAFGSADLSCVLVKDGHPALSLPKGPSLQHLLLDHAYGIIRAAFL